MFNPFVTIKRRQHGGYLPQKVQNKPVTGRKNQQMLVTGAARRNIIQRCHFS